MNFKLFIIAFLLFLKGNSQSFEETLRNEVCICLKEQFFPEMNGFKCYENLALNYGNELEQYELDKTKDGGELYGDNVFENLFLENQQYYFNNCGRYFETIKLAHDETIRQSLGNAKTDSIENLNEYIEKYEFNSNFIHERGVLYLKEGKYSEAIKDFNQLLIEDSSNTVVLLLKAISLEKSGNFILASKVYLEAYENSNERRYKLASELMKYLSSKD